LLAEDMALSALSNNPMERLMLQSNDLSRSFTALNQDSTLIVVIEMSQSSWLSQEWSRASSASL
jgi:hypothetical protein